MLFYFYGVSVGDNRMNGYIKSGDLIDGYMKSWLPQYQRERVHSKKKINELISIFKNHKPLDSVRLNFLGNHTLDETEAILDGKFHIIDGQQRLLALRDSGVRDYKVPVELYLGLSYDEEVKLFQQFNKDATKLKFGELAKSMPGLYPDILRRALRKKEQRIPVTVTSKANGLTLPVICTLVWIIHKKMHDGLITEHVIAGKQLLDFIGKKDHTEKPTQMTEFALNNLLSVYAEIFGYFDSKAICYRRGFLLPCAHVLINYFLQDDGKFDFGRFDHKVRSFTDLVNNARVREVVARGGDSACVIEMYNTFINHLNHKMRSGHLPLLHELRLEKKMVKDGYLESVT